MGQLNGKIEQAERVLLRGVGSQWAQGFGSCGRNEILETEVVIRVFIRLKLTLVLAGICDGDALDDGRAAEAVDAGAGGLELLLLADKDLQGGGGDASLGNPSVCNTLGG